MWFFLSFLGSMLLVALGGQWALRPWRATVGQHWTERARVLWPARTSARALTIVSIVSPVLAWLLFSTDAPPLFSLIGGAVLGVILGSYPTARSVDPGLLFNPWLKRQLMGLVMYGVILGIYFWLLLNMPGRPSAWDCGKAVLGFVVILYVVTGAWLPWLLNSRGNTPQLSRLRAIVESESADTKVSVRHVWISDLPYANAMALIYTGNLIFTRRLLDALNDEEVAAVCRHEIAHLAEPRGVKLARLAGSLYWLPLVFLNPLEEHFGPWGILVLFLLVFLSVRLTQNLRHRLEKRADAASLVSEASPAIYARALEKIYELNQMPAVMPSKRVHPSLYDRMLAAGVQPDYPRPQKPARLGVVGYCAVLIPVALVIGREIWLWHAQ